MPRQALTCISLQWMVPEYKENKDLAKQKDKTYKIFICIGVHTLKLQRSRSRMRWIMIELKNIEKLRDS